MEYQTTHLNMVTLSLLVGSSKCRGERAIAILFRDTRHFAMVLTSRFLTNVASQQQMRMIGPAHTRAEES
jgi:hypothetical protein